MGLYLKHLFMDFYTRLNSIPARKSEEYGLYSTSLKEQYDNMKIRFGINAADSLQEFAAYFFEKGFDNTYYFSWPALTNREVKKEREDDKFTWLRNVFIRAEKNYATFLPQNIDVYFVGDISASLEGKLSRFVVKGIELIDSTVPKVGETKLYCDAVCAFTSNIHNLPEFGTRDFNESVLTLDNLNYIIANSCPIKKDNLYRVMKKLDEYDDYLRFREYYLSSQNNRHEKISDAVACDSYAVSRSEYDSDEDKFASNVLDNQPDLIRSEQVILDRRIGNAEDCPLIRVDIRKNRKNEVFKEKNKAGKSKFQSWLYRFSNDSVKLGYYSANRDANNGATDYYRLGERHAILFDDIEPDYTDLEVNFENEYRNRSNAIDAKYEGIVKTEVEEYIASRKDEIEQKYETMLEAYRKQLDDSLDKEVAENKDKAVVNEYNRALLSEQNRLNAQLNLKANSLNDKIEKIKEKLEKFKRADKKSDEYGNLQDELAGYENDLEETNKQIEQNKIVAAESLRLKDFYVTRNVTLVEKKREELNRQQRTEIEKLRSDKRNASERSHQSERESEKRGLRAELEEKLEDDKAKKKDEETIRCYHIYYRPANTLNDYDQISRDLKKYKIENLCLMYDDTAEVSKFKRQRKALSDLKAGNVRNPYLAAYLFTPKALPNVDDVVEEPEWLISQLNPRQKKAVRGAVSNKGIYMLQGPPGTGKTQVIAEITAQLVMQGKKVLISSETHKAIDNVFERLPKVPEIRPLRLIPSNVRNRKETNYGLENLTDNFYGNIAEKLDDSVKKMDSFENLQSSFNEKMNALKFDYDRLLKMRAEYSEVEKNKTELTAKINNCNSKLADQRGYIDDWNAEIDTLKRTKKAVSVCNFSTYDDLNETYLKNFENEVRALLKNYKILSAVDTKMIGNALKADLNDVRNEIAEIKSSGDEVRLNAEKAAVRAEMFSLLDEVGNPPKEGSSEYSHFKACQKRIIDLNSQNGVKRSYQDMAPVLSSFLPENSVNLDTIDSLLDEIKRFKREVNECAQKTFAPIDAKISEYENEKIEANDKMAKINLEKNGYNESLSRYNDTEINIEYGNLETQIRNSVNKFFTDFGIEGEYEKGDFAKAFKLIQAKSDNLRKEYIQNRANYEKKTPVFKNISKYIKQKEVRDQDRPEYTTALYDCVNVFGITCSSADKYTGNNNEGLKEYGIKELDIKKMGIDIVIIDEVSKSSFLELLIPLLYGKSVVLVGDHRQLPPMYDLKHLRKDDFESLNEEYVDFDKNKKFTELYETCVFKNLFENISPSYKTMLNTQYRCHSQIMDVFNFFYGGNTLKVGSKEQDDKKAHNLSVVANGKSIIDPEHHVYFINCDEEEQFIAGSTSIHNDLEASVAVELIKLINDASNDLVKSGVVKMSNDPKEDTRPSVGVICTYSDQARIIYKRLGGRKAYTGLSDKQDEKLVVNTVDDFQGDERDIIIVSMVRNTTNRSAKMDFVSSFERINVSLSRARTLLIILGSRKFLSENVVIDYLPDLSSNGGDGKRHYHVFMDIIDYIRSKGRIIDSTDVVGQKPKGGKKQ